MKRQPILVVVMAVVFGSAAFANLSDGLVAHYPFNGNANDESGSGHDGTVYGAVLTTDPFGNPDSAYLFDGLDDHIEVPNTDGVFDLTSAWTITAWCKPLDWMISGPAIWKTATNGLNNDTFGLACHDDNWILKLERASDDEDIAVTAPYTPGKWYYLVGTYDGQYLSLYIDGDLYTTLNCGSVIAYIGPAPLMVGSSMNTNHSPKGVFNGPIDEVRIYNRALTADEVWQLYEIPGPPCGWIAFVSNQGGDGHIWAIRPDGTGLRQLTDIPGAPQWSPDSTKIAYAADVKAQIWVYDWFSGTNTKIYDGADYGGQFYATGPAWSPDGSKILFTEQTTYNNPHITMINADGTGRAIIPVEPGYVQNTSWAPSGTAFVYARRNSPGHTSSCDLWIYDFTATGDIMDGNNIRLTQGAGGESTTKVEPDWVPSDKMVVRWGHNLALLDPGESPNWGDPANPDVVFITDDAAWPSLVYAEPSWSPDGSHIVYRYYDGIHSNLWVMDASGYNRYALMTTQYAEQVPDWGCPPPPCWKELFFDDFDDGDYDGWSVTHPKTGDPATAPDIVPSPEGYSLRGVGSGYSHDPGLNVFLTYPLAINNAGQLKVEMRAKSGPQWPNSAWVVLLSGDDSYSFGDYGEGNQWAQFTPNVGGVSEWYNYSINANVWHDFAWTRDADGWWSLSIDGSLVWEDFCQDNRLTSFDPIGLHILRNQSEIEWVRISGVCVIPVAVDIKPQSCPNPLNVKDKGMLPVAILGTEDFDVNQIDIASIRLEGVAPVRSSYEDVATPVSDGNECECTTAGPDGYTDLTLKFKTQEIVEAIGEVNDADVLSLALTGVLFGERPIEGAHCVLIRGEHKPFNKADINRDGVVDLVDLAAIAESWLQSSITED
jgi:hypothetical protein